MTPQRVLDAISKRENRLNRIKHAKDSKDELTEVLYMDIIGQQKLFIALKLNRTKDAIKMYNTFDSETIDMLPQRINDYLYSLSRPSRCQP